MNPHFRAEILAMTTAELAREPTFDPGTQCEGDAVGAVATFRTVPKELG